MKPDKIPQLAGNYVNVYRPSGAIYPGPSGTELRHGRNYDEWVPNDHTFAIAPDGIWHAFGITHPLTTAANIHEGEVQLFHAVAAADWLAGELKSACFQDQPFLLPPSARPNEVPEIHSPFIVKRNGLYHMVYGPTHFRLAVSPDLQHWTLRGELFLDPDGGSRDPQIMKYNGSYYLSYCSGNEVRMRVSDDLIHWGSVYSLLTLPAGISPESPFMLEYDQVFYLLVCTWGGNWDQRTVTQAYQHKTLVFASATPYRWNQPNPLATLDAHAPEIIRHHGEYFLSSAEWPYRGINLVRLKFK